MDFEGKVALIVGVDHGIGRAIVEALAVRDTKVIGTTTSENGTQTIGDCLGVNNRGLMSNVADPASIGPILEKTRAKFGKVDILVSNTGVTRDNLLMRMEGEKWNDTTKANLSSVFRLPKVVMRVVMEKRHGRTIAIGSMAGTVGNGGQVNYAAAKAGLVDLSKSLVREVTSHGIVVNVVVPGFTKTGMTHALSDDQHAGILAQVPAGRLSGAQEIANAVTFLAFDEAAYIVGETLHMNGGMYII